MKRRNERNDCEEKIQKSIKELKIKPEINAKGGS